MEETESYSVGSPINPTPTESPINPTFTGSAINPNPSATFILKKSDVYCVNLEEHFNKLNEILSRILDAQIRANTLLAGFEDRLKERENF